MAIDVVICCMSCMAVLRDVSPSLCCAVLYCTVLCCAVLCCAVLCCAVLCCAVLYCAVLCCVCVCVCVCGVYVEVLSVLSERCCAHLVPQCVLSLS